MWQRRLGYSDVIVFCRILPLTVGHNLNSLDVHKTHECINLFQGKFSGKPSKWQLPTELSPLLYQIHGDICGPINLPSGTFRYFFVLIDSSSSHLEVSLLPIRNMVFPKLLAILIWYRNHFPDYSIKYLRMDNTHEFRSHTFEDYCIATGFTLTYSVLYEYSQNGLAETIIKKIQFVTRPLLLQANLPSSMWGHTVLHATPYLNIDLSY